MIDELGVSDGYFDVDGVWHATDAATRAALRTAVGEPAPDPPGMWFVPAGHRAGMWSPCRIELEDGTDAGTWDHLPSDLPIGYHRLHPTNGTPASTLVVHPERCPAPPAAWGVAAQVYALWTARTWGIGDLREVEQLGRAAAARGAGLLLLSPLHAPAPSLPQEASPYSPSSRCWWNPLLLPVDGLRPPSLAVDPARLIDRDVVWPARRAALWEAFLAEDGAWPRRNPMLWDAIEADSSIHDVLPMSHHRLAEAGLFAAWSALAERHGPRWTGWPDELRIPGPAIAEHVHRDPELSTAAAFHAWCQRRLHAALTTLGSRRGPSGRIGLVGDMAVGFAPDGFDAWRYQSVLAGGDARLGAPPDELAPQGQNWGLPPFSPWKLRAAGYRPLIDTLRATLTGMAGIRIDHMMGLFRQYWALPGGTGGYVHFPAEELLAIVALEAHRAGAFVIGEDLGTVPPEVRPAMHRRGMLGTKVVVLEDAPPIAWPVESVGTLTTHDLPTMAGVLHGVDGTVDMRARLAGALGPGGSLAAIEVAAGELAPETLPDRLIDELHRALLAAPSTIRLVTTDDLCATPRRENVPGTVGPPNWCRPLPLPLDELPWDRLAPPVAAGPAGAVATAPVAAGPAGAGARAARVGGVDPGPVGAGAAGVGDAGADGSEAAADDDPPRTAPGDR